MTEREKRHAGRITAWLALAACGLLIVGVLMMITLPWTFKGLGLVVFACAGVLYSVGRWIREEMNQ